MNLEIFTSMLGTKELLLNIGVKPLMKHSTLLMLLATGKSYVFQKILQTAVQLED